MPDYFLIAKIVALHGKQGFIKAVSYSDFPDRFFSLKNVFIDFFGAKKKFSVEEVKRQNEFFLIKFANFNSDKESEILLNKEIFVDEQNAVQLPDDHFFIHDLIGSKVLRNDEMLGTIVEVLSYPANDVYVVVDEGKKETLIPAVLEFIESFNPSKKILTLKPGKDLYDED